MLILATTDLFWHWGVNGLICVMEAEGALYRSASVPSPGYNRLQGFDPLPSRLPCNSIANSDSIRLVRAGLRRLVSSVLLSPRNSSWSDVNRLHRATRFMRWQPRLLELRGNCHKLHPPSRIRPNTSQSRTYRSFKL
jgi:hypothetical protein